MSTLNAYFKQQKKHVDREPASKKEAPPAGQAPSVTAQEYTGIEADGLTHHERVLRQFDLTSKYGPCTGMTRLERWNRAERLGLQPPAEVRQLLVAAGANSPIMYSLWHGRV